MYQALCSGRQKTKRKVGKFAQHENKGTEKQKEYSEVVGILAKMGACHKQEWRSEWLNHAPTLIKAGSVATPCKLHHSFHVIYSLITTVDDSKSLQC